MFRFLLGRRMAADEDEEAVGGDAAAQKGDAASGDESDNVDEGSTGSAVRLEDVLLQLTEAEQREDDDALRASFSGVSEEDRLVLMQFLPQLELLKDDKKSKGFAEKDSSTDPNPPPSFTNGFSEPESQLSSLSDDFAQQEAPLPSFANGFAEQEPSLMNQPQPDSTDDAAEAEPSLMKQTQPASTDDAAEAEPSLMKQPQPASPDDAAEAEPSLMKQPRPASPDDAAEAEPSLMKQPQPSSTDDAAEVDTSLMKQPQPASTDDAAEAEPSPETEPLPHVTDNLAVQEDPPEAADPLPPLSNPIPLPSRESKGEPHRGGKTEESDKLDAIMKELKSIKRQQTITHCLVSALIFVTAIWQVSEASMVLSVKDKVTHPFRAIGGFLSRALLGGEKQRILDSVPSPPTIPRMDVTQLAHIKFPELSHSHMLLPSAVVESVDT